MVGEKILIVDDEKSLCEYLSILLEREGYQVTTAHSGKDALELVKEASFDVVVTDIRMKEVDGMAVLGGVREIDPSIPVIIMTAYASQQTAIEAVNKGAFYYLIKKAQNDEIRMVIKKALEVRQLRTENRFLKTQLRKRHDSKRVVGNSDKIHEVFQLVNKVAGSDSTILIYGESGTGKELIAREIHYRSQRADGPFVSINCGALPESLLESELFGHVKGSFTGAVRDKAGLFTVARGGTFFLDEVGETSASTQVKLLRVLQEREIIPVGGTRAVSVDVRLIAATNADLEAHVQEGRFRADLFYRLNVIPVVLPPLRERREDIPLLVDHFLAKYCEKRGCDAKSVCKEGMELLMKYEWPGNVRELENVIERAVILQEERALKPDDFPERVRFRSKRTAGTLIGSTSLSLEELEREYLVRVLTETGWQKKRAAQILGIDASTLYRKIQRYGIRRETKEAVIY